MFKILITIIIIIVIVLLMNYYNIINVESFRSSSTPSSIPTSKPYPAKKDLNLQKIKSKISDEKNIKSIENKILFSNKDYNENLSIDNKDNQYFYTDMINQSNINETAFNIVYSIDPIDYADVETGLEKCNKECKGVCFENGYDGIATCYPKETTGFDFGTLYKNPTFTYGYNAYGPNNLKK